MNPNQSDMLAKAETHIWSSLDYWFFSRNRNMLEFKWICTGLLSAVDIFWEKKQKLSDQTLLYNSYIWWWVWVTGRVTFILLIHPFSYRHKAQIFSMVWICQTSTPFHMNHSKSSRKGSFSYPEIYSNFISNCMNLSQRLNGEIN